jgi:hypothetical protein
MLFCGMGVQGISGRNPGQRPGLNIGIGGPGSILRTGLRLKAGVTRVVEIAGLPAACILAANADLMLKIFLFSYNCIT